MINGKRQSNILINIGIIISFTIYCAAILFLFHQYVIGEYHSDFPLHIEEAVNNQGYSMAHVLLKWACNTGYGDKIISIIMVLITMTTGCSIAILSKYIINRCGVDMDYRVCMVIGVMGTFITQIYIPVFAPHFYVHETTLAPNWHNTTFLFMRLFGFLVLSLFFYLRDKYTEPGRNGYFILFTVLLCLVNFAKPNFILAFAPMMLLVMIFDFIAEKGKIILYSIKFGICVLVSLPIVLVQAFSVYDDGSQIIISAQELIAIINEPIKLVLVLLTNIGFPLFVVALVVLSHSNYKNNKILIETWIVYIISFLQKMFMTETGDRRNHGNYAWGSYFFCTALHIVSLCYVIALLKNKSIKRTYGIIAIALMALEVISGVAYLGFLLAGENYII